LRPENPASAISVADSKNCSSRLSRPEVPPPAQGQRREVLAEPLLTGGPIPRALAAVRQKMSVD
jgi:hypothetical protein